MKRTVKAYTKVSIAITLLFIVSNKVLSQSETHTALDIKVTEDTVFFDLSNDSAFPMLEKYPQFPGGESALVSYIIRNTKYPQTAIDDSISGKVFIKFAINIDGSIDDVHVLRGVRSDIDNECIKVIKEMPFWKPAEVVKKAHKGYYWTRMRMYYSIPIIFTLDKQSTPKGVFIIRSN